MDFKIYKQSVISLRKRNKKWNNNKYSNNNLSTLFNKLIIELKIEWDNV
jgi:hypothetical protein